MRDDLAQTLDAPCGLLPLTFVTRAHVPTGADPVVVQLLGVRYLDTVGGDRVDWDGLGITGFDQRLVVNADSSVTYFGDGGLSGVFTPTDSTHYTAPAQFQMDLLKTSTGWTLIDHGSQTKSTFNSAGRLVSSTDRNGNTTTFNYTTSGLPKSTITEQRSIGSERPRATVSRS